MDLLNQFIKQIIAISDYTDDDIYYLKNRIMALVGEEHLDHPTQSENIIDLKNKLIQAASKNGKVGNTPEEQDCLGAELMNFITPIPSKLNKQFWQTYINNPSQAIAHFYTLSKQNDYIKTQAIAKNIAFITPSQYGDLEITINLAKPEKDPKAIAAAKNLKASSYPTCQLCMENEGYQGRINYPARANHRIIRLNLLGEEWGFQYSPYAYFNEHSIVLSKQHVPMIINRKTFSQLMELTDILPNYFVGSNADLPIVGGSILTHNHYQSGKHIFPMERAPIEHSFTFEGFQDISAGIVKWPMSVIRLQGYNKDRIVQLADKILHIWRDYSDPLVDIIAYSNNEPHHTITPIARKKNETYELDLVLRDNHTSAEYPDGVYHPHKDIQHIKKENIGLIEVMGLAILPPRLKTELMQVEQFLLNQTNEIAEYHLQWANSLKTRYSKITQENVQNIIYQSVGDIFVRVLEDAGVYKRTPEGQAAFIRFIQYININ